MNNKKMSEEQQFNLRLERTIKRLPITVIEEYIKQWSEKLAYAEHKHHESLLDEDCSERAVALLCENYMFHKVIHNELNVLLFKAKQEVLPL